MKKNKTKSSKSHASKKKAAKTKAKKKITRPARAYSALREIEAKPVTTTITARIDIGFGNALYLRGEGPGLSWSSGILLNCVDSDKWELVLGDSSRPFVFKLLINDVMWSSGPDFTVAAGERLTLTPEF